MAEARRTWGCTVKGMPAASLAEAKTNSDIERFIKALNSAGLSVDESIEKKKTFRSHEELLAWIRAGFPDSGK